jgi:hypothetical protein
VQEEKTNTIFLTHISLGALVSLQILFRSERNKLTVAIDKSYFAFFASFRFISIISLPIRRFHLKENLNENYPPQLI